MTGRGKPAGRGDRPFWWGVGDAPLECWPGTSIDFVVTWSSARSRWETHGGKYYFDRDAADRICGFFPAMLKHHIGEFAGQPFHLLDYQSKLVVRPLWGWRRSVDGRRRFNKTFDFLPKGQGKSPMGAGLGVYGARCDGEQASEVYCVAADRDQARIVHDNAKIMVEACEELSDGAEILRDSIYWKDSKSVYKVLSSDAATKHGFRPYMVIFDEIHAQKNRDLYEALKRSMVKRREPMMIIMTHAGIDDEGIGYEEYEYAKNVLTGANPDESCLPVIFELDPKSDWSDIRELERVNPGVGVTIQRDGLVQAIVEAQAEPRKLNDLLMFHGNRWVNQAVAWIPVDWWDACKEPMPSDEELKKYPCANATDMAQKIDLAANVTGWRLPLEASATIDPVELLSETESGAIVRKSYSLDFRVVLMPQFWLPEETLQERVRNDHVRYDIYRDAGELIQVDGAIVGAEAIVRYLVGRDGKSGMLGRFPKLKGATFAYDPAFATEVGLSLRDGYGLTVAEVLQNYKHLSEACQVFEALVKAKRIIHGGHRLLRLNLENVAVKRDDAGRIRPVKPKKATKRIDGIVAAIMVISRLMLMAPERKKKFSGVRLYTPGGFVSVGDSTETGDHAGA